MHFKILACNVFFRELCLLAAQSPHTLSIEFFELGEHARPAKLHAMLQGKIDQISQESPKYDAVLLAYGLCGRATDGLIARREKLVIARAHDCCTLLLGSRDKFAEYFKDMPSTPFSSIGFVERGSYFFDDGQLALGEDYQHLVEKYGEENAKYIYESLHPKLDGKLQPVYFIQSPVLPDETALTECLRKAQEEGREVKIVSGSLKLLKGLLNGPWPESDYLVLSPPQSITQTGDWDQVISAK